MTGELALLLADIGAGQLALLAAVAFVSATVSGMSGVGGGLVLAIFIAPVVGVKAVVPTVGIAALIAHVIRVWVYREAIVWRPALVMLAGAIPATLVSARFYVDLPADIIAAILGVFLLVSVPMRRLMAKRDLRFGARSLGLIAVVYGLLSGTTLGGGLLVIPALLGAGLAGMVVLATDAVIGLASLIAKTVVFGSFDVLTPRLLLIGCLLGSCMIPGTAGWWCARRSMSTWWRWRSWWWRAPARFSGAPSRDSPGAGGAARYCLRPRPSVLLTICNAAARDPCTRRGHRAIRRIATSGRHQSCASC